MPKLPDCYRCGKQPCECRDSTTLYCGDCREVLRRLPPNTFSAVVTDPPYGLEFMGKSWDHGVPGVPFWEAALRVAKPGAMLLAFGGTRTYHRLTCAIEDAGWEIRDCLMWLYGSGFPKSHNVGKAIDKAAGAERVVVRQRKGQGTIPNDRGEWGLKPNAPVDITIPATPEAQQWQGWGTALKPAWEPIILARKPLTGTVAANCLEHGTGALNIDGCRVGTTDKLQTLKGSFSFAGSGGANEKGKKIEFRDSGLGRWPANLVLSHHPECVCRGTKRVKGTGKAQRSNSGGKTFGGSTDKPPMDDMSYADADGLETVEDWDCVEGCPMRLFPETKSEGTYKHNHGYGNIGEDSIFMAGAKRTRENAYAGDSGSAARFFYCAKASKRERTCGGKVTNAHPTVKPLAIMEYLLKLVTMPERNYILDPFCGSGSTLVACKRLRLPCLGIDSDPEAVSTAMKRLKYVNTAAGRLGMPVAKPKKRKKGLFV